MSRFTPDLRSERRRHRGVPQGYEEFIPRYAGVVDKAQYQLEPQTCDGIKVACRHLGLLEQYRAGPEISRAPSRVDRQGTLLRTNVRGAVGDGDIGVFVDRVVRVHAREIVIDKVH